MKKVLRFFLQISFFSRSIREFHVCSELFRKSKLTSQEISAILQANEFTKDFKNENCSVKFYDSSQLGSNSPIEDTRAEGKCVHSKGLLMGVFDGHSGPYCAQVVAKHLFDYICVGLAPHDALRQHHDALIGKRDTLVEKFNEHYDLVPELDSLYRGSLISFIEKLQSNKGPSMSVTEAFKQAMMRLDEDISSGALEEHNQSTSMKAITVAMSGSVACLVHIDEVNLHVANVGDCRAVLGRLGRNNSITAKELSQDHNAENVVEVHRIRQEHPADESDSVLRGGRLLGQLAPLRAFGDVRYKWSKDDLERIVVPHYGSDIVPPRYQSPPYLTAKPEITHHRLSYRDKFLIIASDGFWDEVTPWEAVNLVANHIRGKQLLDPFKLENTDMTLKEINKLLIQRKQCSNIKPVDRNSATHLIRKAIAGGSNEEERLSEMLTFPQDMVRYFRDDITVTVIYFDSEYFQLHSS